MKLYWTTPLACGWLAACGGSDSAPAATPTDPVAACQSISTSTIAAAKLSLPSNGAVISAATLVKATDAGNTNGEYCRVTGSIKPVDTSAPDIKFQVNLPSTWNGKALQSGGGAYSGNIPDTLGIAIHGLQSSPTPLALGYMTLASDSGHQSTAAADASFAVNDEALNNYGYMHIKKTRDVAAALAELRYGSAIKRMYYVGGSTGGREALTAALRWPESYDGVISHYPTAQFLGLRLWGAAAARTIYDNASAGWIPPALVNRIAAETTSACDPLDGLTDGIVSNMAACRARSSAYLASITCTNGETGHPANCLTAAQLRTISLYHDGYTLPYPFANGLTRYAGYNSLEGITMEIGSQPAYAPPSTTLNALHASRADQFAKFFLTRDPNFNLLTLDIQNPGVWQTRIQALSNSIDATNPDFTAFNAKGGKVLLAQGLDDASVSPHSNTALYQSIVARHGQATADAFIRFYQIPGFAHGTGKFRLSWDHLAALDNWVERGTAPGTLVGVDTNTATNGRTRPMCVFPSWPQYKGSGSVDSYLNYTCVTV